MDLVHVKSNTKSRKHSEWLAGKKHLGGSDPHKEKKIRRKKLQSVLFDSALVAQVYGQPVQEGICKERVQLAAESFTYFCPSRKRGRDVFSYKAWMFLPYCPITSCIYSPGSQSGRYCCAEYT
ncbi:uncharacterized protein LOC122556941 isoform X2 [Chiloscyllium plagiosum]|uniref:uncharacterized protein LOC122556941 isoform X2 n=1 Tax=Chiloscyllium plagiosum TaxID=36176 RepID=UPI001CB813A9|nr:uncharacterized protein LOC122556941 isoform X2 [Chiloscyllium plagiosum]